MEKNYWCSCDLENVFNKLFIPSLKEMLRVDVIVERKESAKIMIIIK